MNSTLRQSSPHRSAAPLNPIVFRRAAILVLLTGATIPFIWSRGGALNIANWIGAGTVFLATTIAWQDYQVRKQVGQNPRGAIWVGVLFTWILGAGYFNVVVGGAPALGLALALFYAASTLSIFLVLSACLRADLDWQIWHRFVAILGAVAAIASLSIATFDLDSFLGIPVAKSDHFFAGLSGNSSIFRTSNTFGLIQVLAVLSWASLAWRTKRRWLWLLLGLLIMSGVVASGRRAAILAIIPALMVLIEARGNAIISRGVIRAFVPLILIVVAGLVWLALQQGAGSRGLAGREILWPTYLELIVQRPMVGYGFMPAPSVQAFLEQRLVGTTSVHNAFLSMAFRAGLPAALVFMGLLGHALIRALAARRTNPAAAYVAGALTGAVPILMTLDFTMGGVTLTSVMVAILIAFALRRLPETTLARRRTLSPGQGRVPRLAPPKRGEFT